MYVICNSNRWIVICEHICKYCTSNSLTVNICEHNVRICNSYSLIGNICEYIYSMYIIYSCSVYN